MAEDRKSGKLKDIEPDSKSQVTFEYIDGKPSKVKSVVISSQHSANVDQAKVRELLRPYMTKSIPKHLDLLTITIEEAIKLLSSKTSSSSILKNLGHDNEKNVIVIKNGRYGKFITNGKVNAPMPKGILDDELKLDEAIKILSTRKPKKFKKRK